MIYDPLPSQLESKLQNESMIQIFDRDVHYISTY